MTDDFLYVLENYPNADLSKKEDREMIASALSNIMCAHHIVSYTDLDAVKDDPKMTSWIKHCKTKQQEDDKDQMQIPFERGL
tara:strand:- start:2836 stop:3081 length:246 start_codon:yes stop_codon:yes gene_type:complete